MKKLYGFLSSFYLQKNLFLKLGFLIIFIFSYLRLISEQFPYTGDEVHYAEMGLSVWYSGNFNDDFINNDFLKYP